MADHAKLFRNGGSQAVRLPKGCRFEGQDGVVLDPCSPAWSAAFPGLAGVVGDFPRPADLPPVEPGPDFDG